MGNEHRIAHMLEGIYERNTMLNSNLNHKTCHALISCFKHIVTIWPGWAHQGLVSTFSIKTGTFTTR
jgi:hypothetical protein